MPPFRNPFGRKPPIVNGTTTLHDENTPPSKLNGDAASQTSGYASSRASSSLSIKKREEPSEYKLSALSAGKEKLLVTFPNVVYDVVQSSQLAERERTFLHFSRVFRFLSQVIYLRTAKLPRSSIKDLERPQPTSEEAFEDVGLDDEAKQQPPKRRGIFARFGDSSETATSGDGSRPSSSHRGFHLPGRKRGQSGQGAELGNISRPPAPVTKEPEGDNAAR
ncbi:MAG: hypothetical protein LQ338_004559 [Usnochroma carphineum]|nr:MAG: hypothetical protein LQ338_004559 [Usnochroma carphineum]